MTRVQHAIRIGLLTMGACALFGWVVRHTEVCFADGLRYIQQAERIDGGRWHEGLVRGVDHPLHPLGIAAVHRLLGGEGPASWERAALALCFVSFVFLVIPVYLLTRELFGDQTAWLGALLVIANPIVSLIAVNVLSESTFLLFWATGLWGAVRYLRTERHEWLPLAIVSGALAYLTRPEGMLLPLALAATVLIAPLFHATRFKGPFPWWTITLVLAGLCLLVGPYIALKGGIGTKPAIARVVGLAPRSLPLALEREIPLTPDQTTWTTYHLAVQRMFRALRLGGTAILFPFALVGFVLVTRLKDRMRVWLFLGIVLTASAFGLVRLHVTGGYCGARHGVVPGMILTMAAAYTFTCLMSRVSIRGWFLGQPLQRITPGAAAWAALIALCITTPNTHLLAPFNPDPFSVYRTTAAWLAQHTHGAEQVLDLTDWSLYFSERPGYRFANVYDGPSDPNTRWIVVRKPHLAGRWHYSQILRQLIGGREPVTLIPPHTGPNRMQILIYDRRSPTSPQVTAAAPRDPGPSRR